MTLLLPTQRNTLSVVAEGVLSSSVVGALAGAAHQVERALAGCCCDLAARARTSGDIGRRVLDGQRDVNRGTTTIPSDEGTAIPALIGNGPRSG